MEEHCGVQTLGEEPCAGKHRTRKASASQVAKPPSRWQRDKSRIEGLEKEAQDKKALASRFEAENQELRLRMSAMERALSARDQIVNCLSIHTTGQSAPCMSSMPLRDQQEWAVAVQHATTSSLASMVCCMLVSIAHACARGTCLVAPPNLLIVVSGQRPLRSGAQDVQSVAQA